MHTTRSCATLPRSISSSGENRSPASVRLYDGQSAAATACASGSSAADDKAKLEAEATELKTRIAELDAFSALPLPLALLSGYEALAVFTGTIRPGFEDDLRKAVQQMDVVAGAEPETVLAIFVDRASREAALKVLLDHGFQELRVPKGQLAAFEETQGPKPC